MDEEKLECTEKERVFEDTHMAVGGKSKKILSAKATGEHKHDSKVLPELINGMAKQNGKKIVRVLADGAYDSNSIFLFLANRGMLPCIRVRKNAMVNATNQFLRNLSVILQRDDLWIWKNSKLWQGMTCRNCNIDNQEVFGEYVYSVKYENMVKEIMFKAALYNRLRDTI